MMLSRMLMIIFASFLGWGEVVKAQPVRKQWRTGVVEEIRDHSHLGRGNVGTWVIRSAQASKQAASKQGVVDNGRQSPGHT